MKSRIFALLLFIVAISLFNQVLGIALFVLFILSVLTLLPLERFRVLSTHVLVLFSVVLLVYLAGTLVVHYTNFYPFGGGEGDQRDYHQAALKISNDFRHGDFSLKLINTHLEENDTPHWFPVLVGGLYALTIPDKLVGKMLSLWFVGVSALLLYALALEIGIKRKFAFWVGLSPIFYPSYLYWGGLLLRESIIISLAVFSTLLIMKMQRRFSLKIFLLFYGVLGALLHFRFYFGLAVLFLFPLLFFVLFSLEWKKKLQYGVIIIPLLGFLPQFSGTWHGYYGINDIRSYVAPKVIVTYRESIPEARLREIKEAAPSPSGQSSGQLSEQPSEQLSENQGFFDSFTFIKDYFIAFVRGTPLHTPQQISKNLGSTVIVKAEVYSPLLFIKNYFISFLYMLFGPFPWQIRYARQLFVLLETIPWWVAFFFIAKGFWHIRAQWKSLLPILLISFGILAEIALLLNSYGTYMRIRMPVFLLLITLLPFAFQQEQKKIENQ